MIRTKKMQNNTRATVPRMAASRLNTTRRATETKRSDVFERTVSMRRSMVSAVCTAQSSLWRAGVVLTSAIGVGAYPVGRALSPGCAGGVGGDGVGRGDPRRVPVRRAHRCGGRPHLRDLH